MAMADDRLRLARTALDAGFAGGSVSAAYYAMLYAARAALSEEDRYAKTHRGTWNLFGEVFAATGRFNAARVSEAQDVQRLREGADYDARAVSAEEAAAILDQAERFVVDVAALFNG
jgi:uncharacterized protein (UPF0332 family)